LRPKAEQFDESVGLDAISASTPLEEPVFAHQVY
jgi:hypothetical protein